MDYEITGTTLPAVTVILNEGESVYTEIGSMGWMTHNIKMDTNIKGGLFSGIKRTLSGESFFLTIPLL